MKVTLKKFMQIVSGDNNMTLEDIGNAIGRKHSSLGFSLRNETLTVKDLKKCLEVSKEPLIVKYKGNDYELDLVTLKTK
mgnify:CR=1 FL=1|tara:strand:- start:568 stop:804 length:237 start_codon:yes stop_codon:yes gene_type:complete